MVKKLSLIEQLEYNTREYIKDIEGKMANVKSFSVSNNEQKENHSIEVESESNAD